MFLCSCGGNPAVAAVTILACSVAWLCVQHGSVFLICSAVFSF